ncbi:MAG: membrane-bound lytic murein transglycosylase MltF [Gammaproteobacteria bacterium]|jgi:membrane-bound lytic murein transglycosylase F
MQATGLHPAGLVTVTSVYSSACAFLSATCRRALSGLLCLLLAGCGRTPSILDQVLQQDELIVITRYGPTTYYEGPDGPTGFEFELVKRFAEYMGVELHVVVPPNFNDILPLIALGDAHLAAAGLTVTEHRKQKVRFGPVYQTITPQLVYRSGTRQPESWDDITGLLEVVAGSSHAERLEELKQEHPDLTWSTRDETSTELLELVWEQVIDYTIADSNELDVNRRYYPELKPAFDVNTPRSLAWAFPKSGDNSLFNAAVVFFKRIKNDGTLDQLIERYYGHIRDFDYVGTRRYQAHIDLRLPEYRQLFMDAAKEIGMDWRLLAAVGYQESHWDPTAVSPTGVRGIMMLTQAAAQDTDIKNRLDPAQSIFGGARYFMRMKQRIPEDIPEPDRTWLALAAYNVGYGHLQDARILTRKNKGDPDKWVDVKKNLPLLGKKKWFQQTRFGYARGREPVRYVENIRTYYDILVWHTDKEKTVAETPRPLQIDTPAL